MAGVIAALLKATCYTRKCRSVFVDGIKQCSKCKTFKSVDEFSRRSDSPDQLSYICKSCKAAHKKLKYHQNSEFRQAEIDRVQLAYRNDERARLRHIEGVRRYQNKESVREQRRCRNRERYRSDPFFRLRQRMATNVGKSLIGQKGGRRWESLVGYTMEELRVHIESLFDFGMTWDNYGDWHIDHIIPLASFRPVSVENPAFLKAWSLKNLQPLWAIENFRKGARVA